MHSSPKLFLILALALAVALGVWLLGPAPRSASVDDATSASATENAIKGAAGATQSLTQRSEALGATAKIETVDSLQTDAFNPASESTASFVRPAGGHPSPSGYPRLRILDENGEGLKGVPVGIVVGTAPRVTRVWTGRTSAKGQLNLPPAADIARRIPNGAGRPRLRALLPIPNPPEVELPESGDLSADALDLQLPPVGETVVVLRGPNNKLVKDGAEVRLIAVEALKSQVPHPTAWQSVEAKDGVAKFPFVPVGYQVHAQVDSEYRMPASGSIRGPEASGNTATLDLKLGDSQPVVEARVVGLAKALAFQSVKVELMNLDLVVGTAFARTDFEGYLRTRLEWDGEPGNTLRFSVEGARGLLLGQQNLPRALVRGKVANLGTVSLSPGTRRHIVAQGVVVSDAGRPLAGARVRVSGFKSKDGCLEGDAAQRLISTTGPNGQFLISSDLSPSEFRLSVHRAGYIAPSTQEMKGVATGLKLTLLEGGGLIARVRVPLGVAPESLRARMESMDTGRTVASRALSQMPVATGRLVPLRWASLRPGNYRLVIDSSDGQVAASIEGIRVGGGLETKDERLELIELAIPLRSVTIKVRDEAGAPIPGAVVSITTKGSNQQHTYRTDAGGRVRLSLAHSQVALNVSAKGYRSYSIADLASDTSLTLRPGIRVRLSPGSVESQGFRGRVSLFSMDSGRSSGPRIALAAVIGESGQATLTVPAAGTYRMHFAPAAPEPGCTTPPVVPAAQTVEITDSGSLRIAY